MSGHRRESLRTLFAPVVERIVDSSKSPQEKLQAFSEAYDRMVPMRADGVQGRARQRREARHRRAWDAEIQHQTQVVLSDDIDWFGGCVMVEVRAMFEWRGDDGEFVSALLGELSKVCGYTHSSGPVIHVYTHSNGPVIHVPPVSGALARLRARRLRQFARHPDGSLIIAPGLAYLVSHDITVRVHPGGLASCVDELAGIAEAGAPVILELTPAFGEA